MTDSRWERYFHLLSETLHCSGIPCGIFFVARFHGIGYNYAYLSWNAVEGETKNNEKFG